MTNFVSKKGFQKMYSKNRVLIATNIISCNNLKSKKFSVASSFKYVFLGMHLLDCYLVIFSSMTNFVSQKGFQKMYSKNRVLIATNIISCNNLKSKKFSVASSFKYVFLRMHLLDCYLVIFSSMTNFVSQKGFQKMYSEDRVLLLQISFLATTWSPRNFP